MKSRLAQTLCVLCLVSLRAHYPKHFSSRPLPLPFPLPSHHTASSGSHFARPVCSAMFPQWIGWEASPSNCWAAKAIDQYIVDNADNGGSLPARREEDCDLNTVGVWALFTEWVEQLSTLSLVNLLPGYFWGDFFQKPYSVNVIMIYQYINIVTLERGLREHDF